MKSKLLITLFLILSLSSVAWAEQWEILIPKEKVNDLYEYYTDEFNPALIVSYAYTLANGHDIRINSKHPVIISTKGTGDVNISVRMLEQLSQAWWRKSLTEWVTMLGYAVQSFVNDGEVTLYPCGDPDPSVRIIRK